MELKEIYNILTSAISEANVKIDQTLAAFPEDKVLAHLVADMIDSEVKVAICKSVAEAGRVQRCGIDLSQLKDDMQYTTLGLARVLGKSVETVRRWSNDPRHPLKAHYRKNGAHHRFFIGREVRSAMSARLV